jgi:hypothetical protein
LTNANNKYLYQYSICTLVSDATTYHQMKTSFENNLFNSNNSEFLIVDNIDKNNMDAYEAITYFLKKAQGQFIIICHQDITVLEPETKLQEILNNMQEAYPHWAILGNAGAKHIKGVVKHITNPNGSIDKIETDAVEVKSLDENFLIIKNQAQLCISNNMKGFHFYGTDLCIQANLKGYSCFVISFMLQHHSNGNFNSSFFKAKNEFISNYTNKIKPQFIETTCARLFLGGNKLQSICGNTKIVFFVIKLYYKYFYRAK